MEFCDYIFVSGVTIGAFGFPFLLGFLAGYNICNMSGSKVVNYYLLTTDSEESSDQEVDDDTSVEEEEQYSEEEEQYSEEEVTESDSEEEKEKTKQRRDRILAAKIFNNEFIEQIETFNKNFMNILNGPESMASKVQKLMSIANDSISESHEEINVPDINKSVDELKQTGVSEHLKNLLCGNVKSKEDSNQRYNEVLSILGNLSSFQTDSMKKTIEDCRNMFGSDPSEFFNMVNLMTGEVKPKTE